MLTAVMYGDFFEAPKAATSRRAGPIKGNANKGSKGKGKRKGHGVRFDEEQAEDEGIEEEADEEEDDGRGIIGRLKGDLFDDDEGEADEQSTSCVITS